MEQIICCGTNSYLNIEKILHGLNSRKILLVCDLSFQYLDIKKYFDLLNIPHVIFDGFTSNPLYADICKGVELFNKETCDSIIAIGGGSTIDVAKCIKLYSKMNPEYNYLQQEYKDSKIPLIAMPTTAGTGSESTRYAVIYDDGKKQSVTHESIIPNYVILEHSVLRTLPIYQKKCTMLDALCQAIESWWSINSTDESMQYAKTAIELIMKYKDSYIYDTDEEAAEKIMLAANYAGRAINITQTTAPHAMSYKLTSMYHLPHGHAVASCLPVVWKYMIDNPDQCIDNRGSEYLAKVYGDIALAMQCANAYIAVDKFITILDELDMKYPSSQNRMSDIEILIQSVNLVRLVNNPIKLSENALRLLYSKIIISK